MDEIKTRIRKKLAIFISFMLEIKSIVFYLINNMANQKSYDAWSIMGKSHPKKNIKVLFLGGETTKNYFCNLIYNENYIDNYIGKISIGRFLFFLWRSKTKYDLLIVKEKMRIINYFATTKKFVLPTWVACEIDTCDDIQTQSLSKSTLNNNIRKIIKANFRRKITKELKDLQLFYHDMYLPYITNRFNNHAIIQSFNKMKKKFEDGELIFIEHEKKAVAGALVNYKRKSEKPRIECFGVLKGDFSYVKKGALTAAYYHTIEYLKNKNIKKINFGSSRPFFFDGVLRNKLVWGGKIVCRSSRAFLLWPLSERKCLKNFLSNNPFIFKKNNDLILARFNNTTDKDCSSLSISETKAKNCGIAKVVNLSI